MLSDEFYRRERANGRDFARRTFEAGCSLTDLERGLLTLAQFGLPQCFADASRAEFLRLRDGGEA